MPLKAPNELYYTPAEAQAILSISEPALRGLVLREKLHRIIPPGKKQALFLRSEVDAYAREWQAFLAGQPVPRRIADAWLTFTDDDPQHVRLVAVCIWGGHSSDDVFLRFIRSTALLLRSGEADIVVILSDRDISPVAHATARRYGEYRSRRDGRDYARVQLLSLGTLLLGREVLNLPQGCELESAAALLERRSTEVQDEESQSG